MRKNKKNESGYESSSRRSNQNSQRMSSGRDRSFESDSDLYDDNFYQNESHRGQRSDYDFETSQSDRPYFERYGRSPSQFRNQNDYAGNFPSSELSSSQYDSGFNRSWSPNENHYGEGSARQENSRSYSQGQSNSQTSSRQGLHAGKGPKGYQRSDERIREDVCDALAAHGDVDASEIDVEVSEGIVTLTGSVESRYSKRLAEQALDHVHGVKDIHNQLQIMASGESDLETGSSRYAQSKSKSSKKSSSNYKQ